MIERPSNAKLAALAAPATPMAAMSLPFIIYLPEYFSNALGINLAIVGLMFTVVRLADLIFDPFVGGLMDRTSTRWGRFRPWLLIGVPVVMVGTYIMFMARPGVSPLYLSIGLVLGYIGYSIVNLAQMGLGTDITPDYRERSRVFAWWQLFNGIGLILVLLLPLLFPDRAASDSSFTVQTMGWFILVSVPITIAACVLFVPETGTAQSGHVGRLADYFSLLHLASTRQLLLSQIFIGLAGGIAAAVFIFFFTMLKHLPREYIGLQFVAFFICSMCSAPLWSWMSNRIGKHRALIVGCFGYSGYLVILTLMPPGNLVIFGGAAVLGGTMAAAFDMIPRAMMADVSDEDRLASGQDRTGMLFALLTVCIKLGQALSIGIVYFVLDIIGFRANGGADNPPVALAGVMVLYSIAPIALYLAAAFVASRYRLTADQHHAVRVALGET